MAHISNIKLIRTWLNMYDRVITSKRTRHFGSVFAFHIWSHGPRDTGDLKYNNNIAFQFQASWIGKLLYADDFQVSGSVSRWTGCM